MFFLSSSPDKQKFNSLRTLRLCGEMSESLSAKIGVNLRLSILRIAETCPDGHEGGQILPRSDERGSLDSECLDQLQ